MCCGFWQWREIKEKTCFRHIRSHCFQLPRCFSLPPPPSPPPPMAVVVAAATDVVPPSLISLCASGFRTAEAPQLFYVSRSVAFCVCWLVSSRLSLSSRLKLTTVVTSPLRPCCATHNLALARSLPLSHNNQLRANCLRDAHRCKLFTYRRQKNMDVEEC